MENVMMTLFMVSLSNGMKEAFFWKGDKGLLFFTFLLVFHLLICRQIEIERAQTHQCGLFDKISPCMLKLLIIT